MKDKRHCGIDCPQVIIDCPYACGAGSMLRIDVAAHLSTCPSAPVTCGFAGCPEKVRGGGRSKRENDGGDLIIELDATKRNRKTHERINHRTLSNLVPTGN
jgi:hypothetical protein